MAPFDPVSALIGGALIGLAAVLLMLLNGLIAGVEVDKAGYLARGEVRAGAVLEGTDLHHPFVHIEQPGLVEIGFRAPHACSSHGGLLCCG